MNDRLARTVLLLAALAAALQLGDTYWRARRELLSGMGKLHDFRGPYLGAVDLQRGFDPYRPASDVLRPSDRRARSWNVSRMQTLYSPPVLAAYMPLAAQRYLRARSAFMHLSFLCVLLSVVLLARVLGGGWQVALLGAGWLVGSFDAVRVNLLIGQANSVILLCLCGAAVLLGGRHSAWGGVLVAAAALCKPNIAVVLLGLAAARRWRAAAGMLALPVVAGLGSVLAFGWDVHASFVRSGFAVARHGHTEPGAVSLKSAWLHLSSPASVEAAWLVSVVVVLLVGLFCSARWRAASPALLLALWIPLALLVAPRSHGHDVVWSLVAIAAVVRLTAALGRWSMAIASGVAFVCLAMPRQAASVAGDLLGIAREQASMAPTLGLALLAAIAVAALIADAGGGGASTARAAGGQAP